MGINEKSNGERIPILDKDKVSEPTVKRARIVSYTFVAILLLSAVSVIIPLALNDSGDGNENAPATAVAWNPGGKREAVYKFDHWGENYRKNEMWNRTSYNPLTVSMAELGHHGIFTADSTITHGNPTGMGEEDWLNASLGGVREAKYQEIGLRDHYPFIYANNPNSPENVQANATSSTVVLDWICWIPYRITGTIKNESMARTGADAGHGWHAWFVPHLGPDSASGGLINCTYYGTYLTDAEVTVIKNPSKQNAHYATWFYGATKSFLSGTNDGYMYELQGRIQYSRQAAVAYLGYTDASGNISDWFTTNQGTITSKWIQDWTWNGSEAISRYPNATSGCMAIYTAYEYDLNNSALFALILMLDAANSSFRDLTIRLYSISWGGEILIQRMMERCNATGWWTNATSNRNIRTSMTDYHEDLYWNISARPERADMNFRMVTTYRMNCWEDPSSAVFMGGWMLEVFHNDYMGNGEGAQTTKNYWSYPSPFERYDPDLRVAVGLSPMSVLERVPGTRRYQMNATMWTTPIARNFSKYECFIYDLNTSHYWGTAGRDFIGINPAWVGDPSGWGGPPSVKNGLLDNRDKGNFSKNMYWGKLKLGDYCTPFPIVKNWQSGAYNNVTMVLNISGGTAAGDGTVGIYMDQYLRSSRDYWQGYSTGGTSLLGNRLLFHGAPFIMLDVVPVDRYKVEIRGSHMVGVADPVKITVLNGTGATVTNWNGTVLLQSTDPLIGWGLNGSSHTFVPGDNGIWWTSVTWNASATGNQTITALDRTNSTTSFQDIFGRATVLVVPFIPEFTDVLIPVVGMMAIFFVLGKAKKRKNEST